MHMGVDYFLVNIKWTWKSFTQVAHRIETVAFIQRHKSWMLKNVVFETEKHIEYLEDVLIFSLKIAAGVLPNLTAQHNNILYVKLSDLLKHTIFTDSAESLEHVPHSQFVLWRWKKLVHKSISKGTWAKSNGCLKLQIQCVYSKIESF